MHFSLRKRKIQDKYASASYVRFLVLFVQFQLQLQSSSTLCYAHIDKLRQETNSNKNNCNIRHVFVCTMICIGSRVHCFIRRRRTQPIESD